MCQDRRKKEEMITYIRIFSSVFKFYLVRYLLDIAKFAQIENILQQVSIDNPWNSESRSQWKINVLSLGRFR